MGGQISGFGVWWAWDGLWIAGLLVIGGFFFFSPCFVGGFYLGGVCVMVGWWWLLPCWGVWWWWWLLPCWVCVVVVVAVAVAEGRGGCRWVCGGGGCYLAGYEWLWLWLWLWPKVEVVVVGAVDFSWE